MPYAEMSPGPTVNTLGDHGGEPVLQISGRKTYPTSGHLNMTTVRVTSADYQMNLVEAVYGWLAHDNKVVPHDTLYPDGKTEEQSTQENAEEFSQSQESAKVAALKELDVPVQSWVIVSTVVKDIPGRGQAARRRRDQGRRRHGGEGAGRRRQAGHQAQARREGRLHDRPGQGAGRRGEGGNGRRPRPQNVTITTTKSDDDGEKRAIVGIQAGTDHTFPFTIDIKLADVGGPSAGLMFALGIVDKLTPGQPDRRQVRRRHRHHRRRRQGRPDRRHRDEDGRRARQGRPVLPDARRQLRGRRQGHPGRAHPGQGEHHRRRRQGAGEDPHGGHRRAAELQPRPARSPWRSVPTA